MAAQFRRRLTIDSLFVNLRRYASLYAVSRPESVKHCSALMERATFETGHGVLTIKKTMEHLQNCPDIKISKTRVKSISINDKFKATGTDSGSLFLYERIPQVKYQNPDVEITCTQEESRPFEILVNYIDGDTICLDIENKSCLTIFQHFSRLVSSEEVLET